MTHRGPCQPRPFCDSVILCAGAASQLSTRGEGRKCGKVRDACYATMRP